MLAGCSEGSFDLDTTLDSGVKKLFAPRRTPQQQMILAVSSEDADVRRKSAASVAESKRYNSEWAIKGFIAIALLESNAQTRCVAIRALARTGDPRAVETMLKVLNYEDYPPQEVRPPPPLCRWDATDALANLLERGQVPEEYRESVRDTFTARLQLDSDRHARIAAARGLSFCHEESAIDALIKGLRDDDFAVVHECEESLVKLTGHTHDCNPVLWREWYDANREALFANAGQIPESRRPPYGGRWGKAWHETKQFFIWLWPGTKE